MAGEFFVAAELLRRGVKASVTYGNAKKADIVALASSGTSAVVLEVKTTSELKWIVGGNIPEPSAKLWVFVYLPQDNGSPRYFILNAKEINDILTPLQQQYLTKYRTKNGRDRESSARNIFSLEQTNARIHEGKWEKILSEVGKTEL